MKAAIYTRVSSASQTEGYSLEAQYEQLVKYVDMHNGDLVKVYTDPGISAKNLDRPGVQEMIADMKQGKFDTLIIHKLDRLTRNIGNLNELVEMVIKENVKLISLSENIDTSTVNGRLMIYMLGILAQMFREQLGEEVTKGQSMRASKGLRVSASRPYGYDLGENLAMSVNEHEAVTVRRIYDLFIEGHNVTAIAKKLKGIDKKWNPLAVHRILVNATYLGVAQWKSKAALTGHYIEGAHDAIIKKEVYEAAQEIMGKRKDKFLTQSSKEYCFTTIVKCGVCGKGFSGWTKKYPDRKDNIAYRCNGFQRYACRIGTIAESTLTKLFLGFLENFSFEVGEPQKIVSGKDLAKDKKKLEKLIAESDQIRMNYSRAMGAGKLNFEMYSSLIDEEVKKCESWRMELDIFNQMSPSNKKTRKDLVALLNSLKTDWSRMSVMERKMNLSKVFKFLVINKVDGEWKIIWYGVNE